MPTIDTLTGEVNLTSASAKAYIFHTPHAGGRGVEERHLGLAAKSPQTSPVIRQVSPFPQCTPSVHGYPKDIGGQMIRMTYDIAEGEILKIFAMRRPGAGKVGVSCAQFIRVREGAALHTIAAKLLTDATVVEPFARFTGRFDLLTLEQAQAFGVVINPKFASMFLPNLVAHVMEVSIDAPAIQQATIRQSAQGGATVVVSIPKRRRSIDLTPNSFFPPTA
jgi:hypothetical protein